MLQRLFNKKTHQINVENVNLDRDDWKEFLNKIQPGDEVWAYNDVKPLSGSTGYLLIREGQVVEWFVEVRS